MQSESETGKTSLLKQGKTPWKKPKDMPRRPLSAYNLFFQSERKKLLTNRVGQEQDVNSTEPRKPHGLGFGGMARRIAKKWKELDGPSRAVYEEGAKVEKIRYKREVRVWKKKEKEATSRSGSIHTIKDATLLERLHMSCGKNLENGQPPTFHAQDAPVPAPKRDQAQQMTVPSFLEDSCVSLFPGQQAANSVMPMASQSLPDRVGSNIAAIERGIPFVQVQRRGPGFVEPVQKRSLYPPVFSAQEQRPAPSTTSNSKTTASLLVALSAVYKMSTGKDGGGMESTISDHDNTGDNEVNNRGTNALARRAEKDLSPLCSGSRETHVEQESWERSFLEDLGDLFDSPSRGGESALAHLPADNTMISNIGTVSTSAEAQISPEEKGSDEFSRFMTDFAQDL